MKASNLIAAGTLAALLPFTAALAQSPTPDQSTPSQPTETAPAPQAQGTTFESLDTNSDGKISKMEAAANENVSAQFARYDVNGDGFIERTEVNSANSSPDPKE